MDRATWISPPSDAMPMRCRRKRSRSEIMPAIFPASVTTMWWMPSSAMRIAAWKANSPASSVAGSGVITSRTGRSMDSSGSATRVAMSRSVTMPERVFSSPRVRITEPIFSRTISSRAARTGCASSSVITSRRTASRSGRSSGWRSSLVAITSFCRLPRAWCSRCAIRCVQKSRKTSLMPTSSPKSRRESW